MKTITLGLYYPHDGRQLRRFITALLKQKAAIRIDRINYVHSYTLDQAGKINKQEQKLLHITVEETQKDRCLTTIKKLLNQTPITYFVAQ